MSSPVKKLGHGGGAASALLRDGDSHLQNYVSGSALYSLQIGGYGVEYVHNVTSRSFPESPNANSIPDDTTKGWTNSLRQM